MDVLVILTLHMIFNSSTASLVVVVVKSPIGLLVFGVVAIVAGVATIVFRRGIRDMVVRAQSKSFGPVVGKRMESTRPWAFTVVGVGAISMGVFFLVLLFI